MSLSRLCAGINAAIFAALGALHVYWAAGGQSGKAVTVPERGGRPAFDPGPPMTLAVAGGLFAACGVVLTRAGSLRLMPAHISRLGAVVLALLFAARAIGNFSTVGFSKRVRGTSFATWDDRLFSPLCGLVSSLSFGASR